MKITIFLFMCGSLYTRQVGALDFKAAVVDYNPVSYKHPVIPETRLLQNIAAYEKLAKEKEDYDIIVFPESTLYSGAGKFEKASDAFPFSSLIPDPDSNSIVCEDISHKYASHLKQLSCLAQNIKKFIVINLVENVPCKEDEKCPGIGYNLYNTNVVFNNEGKIVAKYQKYNLFGELHITKPKKQVVTFKLNINVTIGTFTCFDIMFREPALDVVKDVQAVVFPLMWYSELPFLTALQAQQQWAQELNVVLLAAGGNVPIQSSGGSGIFKGKDGLVEGILTSVNTSKVLYADFKTASTNRISSIQNIDLKAKELDAFPLWKDNLESYTSKTLDFNEGSFEIQVCNGKDADKICCDFSVTTTVDYKVLNDGKNHYQYHLVAFSGVRTFSGIATGGIETCAIIACKETNISSCAMRFENYNTITWPLKFIKLEVSANYRKDEKRIQFPNSLLTSIQPLPVSETTWTTEKNGNTVRRKHTITKPQERLLTFGIFGRDYNRDGQEVTKPSQDDNKKPNDGNSGNGGNNGNKDNGGHLVNLHLASIGVACSLVLINCLRL